MAEKGQPITALLRLTSSKGAKRWRIQLSPDAPLGAEELRGALVHEFVDSQADEHNYELTVSGTLGAPIFDLTEKEAGFIVGREPLP